MRWMVYGILALSYALILSARLERAPWMMPATAIERLALWLPLVGLITLISMGGRRRVIADRDWLVTLAMLSAAANLALALIPSIQ